MPLAHGTLGTYSACGLRSHLLWAAGRTRERVRFRAAACGLCGLPGVAEPRGCWWCAWLSGWAGLAGDLGGDDFGDALCAGRQGRVLVAEDDADLACDGRGRRVGGAGALVGVDGPGEGGDGHDQGGERDRVQVPVRALLGAAGGEGGLDLGGEAGAEVGGEDDGGGPGGVCGWVGHGWPPGDSSWWLVR